VIGRLNVGGAAHGAALLSGRRFHPGRYETLLVHGALAAGESSMADLAAAEGAQEIHVPELVQTVSPRHDARALARLRSIGREFRPHIVHTHTAKAGFLGRVAALGLDRPPALVHTFHGHVLEGYYGPAKTRLYREIERRLARRTSILVGVSQATVDDLVRLGIAPTGRFRVIPECLDLSGFAAQGPRERVAARAELGLPDDDVVFAYVGRLVAIKRVEFLIRAFADAARRGPPMRLLVVGDGEPRARLEALAAELGVADRIDFLGYRRDLTRVTAATDAAVLASANEGAPVSLIEAAAAGRPAVATSVGGVPEVVGEGMGIRVPRDREDAFADALVAIASDPAARERMGALARERALARYSVERLIRDVDRLYGELSSASGVALESPSFDRGASPEGM
jgi:glycosyltransferase involved in cell wall biosynthesis